MKRKGKRSKGTEASEGNSKSDQNGDASSDHEEVQPEIKKRKSLKKKKNAPKKSEEVEDSQYERKALGRSSKTTPSKRAEANEENSGSDQNGNASSDYEEIQPEDKKRKTPKKRKYTPKKSEEVEDPQYEVEKVLASKLIRGVLHYLIRWKGYEPESDTWEPESTLDCAELISDFLNSSPKKRGRPKSIKKKDNSPSEEWSETENFEVDRILDVYFKKNGQREFFVSWKGYPMSQRSWEPEENMDCKDLIKKFMSKVEKAQESNTRDMRIYRTPTDRLTLMTDGHRGRRLSKRNQGKQRVHYHDHE